MDFYGDVLGLPRSSVWQRPGQEAVGAEFETGSLTIALLASALLGASAGPTSHPIALRVDDVEAARAELEARGVQLQGRHPGLGRLPPGVLRRSGRKHACPAPPLRAARQLTRGRRRVATFATSEGQRPCPTAHHRERQPTRRTPIAARSSPTRSRAASASDRDLAGDLGRRAPARSAIVGRYVEGLDAPAALGDAAERRLVLAATQGDQVARARLVEAFMPRIASMRGPIAAAASSARSCCRRAWSALLRALERYDPARGVPFWGYATWWVRQAMQQLVAELDAARWCSRTARCATWLASRTPTATATRQGEREPSATSSPTDRAVARPGRRPAGDRALAALARGAQQRRGARSATFGELLADPLAEDAYERCSRRSRPRSCTRCSRA